MGTLLLCRYLKRTSLDSLFRSSTDSGVAECRRIASMASVRQYMATFSFTYIITPSLHFLSSLRTTIIARQVTKSFSE